MCATKSIARSSVSGNFYEFKDDHIPSNGETTRVHEPAGQLNSGSDAAKSAGQYSTAVLDIYSTKPGTVGRRQTTPKSPEEVPMAMVGIVPTKVSAENGAIKPGDLLVTASIPGYAMKGTDRGKMLGAVIGKAMGNLDSGMGVLEVLVTLQ